MFRTRLILTGAVCLGMLGWAAATPPRDPQPYVARAESYALNKQWAEAERCLRQALRFAPNDPDLLAAWAWLAWRQHGDLRGQVALVAALRADRMNVSALLLRSEIREGQGNGAAAIEDLRLLLSRQPDHAPALLLRAKLLARQDRFSEVITDTNRLLRQNPNSIEGLELRAKAQEKLGQLPAALEDWSALIRLQPRAVPAHLSRARLREQLNQIDGAIADYSVVLEQEANHQEALLSRGQLLARTGKSALAVKDFTKFLETQPPNEAVLMQRGRCYEKLRQWTLALADFQAVLKASWHHPEAMQAAARALDRLDRADEALALLKRILEREPNAPTPLLLRIDILHRVDRHEEALAEAEYALRLMPEYPPLLRLRGLIYLHLGRNNEALADFNKCLEALEEYRASGYALKELTAATLQHRAAVYRRQEKLAEALRDLNEAVRLAPEETHSYTQRGYFLQSQGKWDDAIADYEKIQTLPEDEDGVTTRGYAQILVHFLKRDYATGREQATALRLEHSDHSDWLYDLACALAIGADLVARRETGPLAAKLAQELRNEALSTLEASVAKGYNQWPHLRFDQDFTALRGEPRYQHLCRPRQAEKKPKTP
jgi:tetratricopeptide (TPR) repeat protein